MNTGSDDTPVDERCAFRPGVYMTVAGYPVRIWGEWSISVALFSVLLVCPLAGGCGGTADGATAAATPAAEHEETDEKAEDGIAVRVLPVVREPLSSLYSTSATLRADRRATVTARTSGVLEQLLVEEGDDVVAGQPLAILENDEQTIEFQRISASRDNQIREHERARQLRDQDLLSEEDYETTLREAEEARHAADLAELVLSRTVIRAPFEGTVLKRHLDDGGNVNDGTPVYDLADLTPLYADVNVPERQIARLAVAQAVRLIADSSGEEVEARIERLAPEVDPTTGTVKVTLAVRGLTTLRPGGFVRVEIVVDTHSDALVVPRSALVAEGRRWHVYRLAAEGGSVERLEIARGFEEGDRVEIVDVVSGEPLLAGDRIVVVGASALSDGSAVEVLDQEAEETAEEADRDEDPGVAT